MADAPFDPPTETLNAAVSEHLDLKTRVDILAERVGVQSQRLGAVVDRLGAVAHEVAQLRVDVGRAIDIGTANNLTLGLIDVKLTELLAVLRKQALRG
jgi:hypothetical protein